MPEYPQILSTFYGTLAKPKQQSAFYFKQIMPKKVRRRNVLYREKNDGKRRKRLRVATEATATQAPPENEGPTNPAVTPDYEKLTMADIVTRHRQKKTSSIYF